MVKQLSKIGLDKSLSRKLADELNVLLSNYEVYYQSLRSLHWNIKGNNFFELHAKFEELYNDAQIKVDEIAERVLTLGFVPLHTFEDYIKNAKVEVARDISEATPAVTLVVESLKTLVVLEREILNTAEQLGDEGTLTLLTDFITEQEKTIWMYNSWLGK